MSELIRRFARRTFLGWLGALGGGLVVGTAEAKPRHRRLGTYSDRYSDLY